MNRRWRWQSVLALVALSTLPLAAAEKDPQGRLSTELYGLARAAERGQALSSGVRAYDQTTQRVVAVVELARDADPERVTSAVLAAGGELLLANMGFLKVRLPARALREVSALDGVLLLRAPHAPSPKREQPSPQAQGRSSSATTQGRAAMHADEFTARTGADGANVRVGILDEGFKGARELLGNELPADTLATDRVLERLGSYQSAHGTACAEILHDVAPGARLTLADFEDEVEWGQAVDALVAAGVQIISHSIGFDNLYPADGNHPFAAKVDAAVAGGVLFVTAAGNEADKYFQGTWQDTDGDEFLEYGGITEFLPIRGGGTGYVRLRWDDAQYGAAAHDYDLYVVNAAFKSNPDSSFPPGDPRILGRSEDVQRNSGNPLEFAIVESGEEVLYVVIRHDPATPVNGAQRIFLWASQGVLPELGSATGSLSSPADARGALAVGAVNWSSLAVEGFSSRGPTADGRSKPDLAGPDGVDTVTYDVPFFGTSAATPHAAGAAALLLSRTPSLSASALRTALVEATASSGSARSNDSGAGAIDLGRVR